ncbi:msr1497 [Mesorhizobium japonicum MAFF 303099]|uniref:Msr1497 protein n=2 Tax=Mesorhizobium TaxID=68287 RepID=Q98KF8_RHILO|nr:msr1497 [Mesorhizobium japonicum MAFF 303099]
MKGKLMTMTSPILATAFMAATAAILAMRATIVAANRKSMVKVRSRQRHPANTKTQG